MTHHMTPKKIIYRQIDVNGEQQMVEAHLIECSHCQSLIPSCDLKENQQVCPKCSYHHYLSAVDRLHFICDDQSFTEIDAKISTKDPLNFKGYLEKINQDKKKSSLNEAIVCGLGAINGEPCVIAVMDNQFRMGSMGTAVGEKIYRAAVVACEKGYPFIIYTTSGGARMQEGVFSLMQMAKTLAAFELLREHKLLSIVVLTNPTLGGVSASFATEGDIIIAEPEAVVGFAGRRVIENTIKESLPQDFQTAEFLMAHGHIDNIVARDQQREYLNKMIRLFSNGHKDVKSLSFKGANTGEDVTHHIKEDILSVVRKNERPTTLDYISHLIDEFTELHGDSMLGDDPSIVTGIGFFKGLPVSVIGHQRGRSVEENIERNFGMPTPAGFRKAQKLIEQSVTFNRPIITFIDTKGADPTARSEELNQSRAISKCISAMLRATVPIISIIIGEGGSGGGLALATGNDLYMLENAIFSVISPEGAASILWKDASLVSEAIDSLKIRSHELLDLGLIDGVIPEVQGDASLSVCEQSKLISTYIESALGKRMLMSKEELVQQKHDKYTQIGR